MCTLGNIYYIDLNIGCVNNVNKLSPLTKATQAFGNSPRTSPSAWRMVASWSATSDPAKARTVCTKVLPLLGNSQFYTYLIFNNLKPK